MLRGAVIQKGSQNLDCSVVATVWDNDLTPLGQSLGLPHFLPVLCWSSSFLMIAPVLVSCQSDTIYC